MAPTHRLRQCTSRQSRAEQSRAEQRSAAANSPLMYSMRFSKMVAVISRFQGCVLAAGRGRPGGIRNGDTAPSGDLGSVGFDQPVPSSEACRQQTDGLGHRGPGPQAAAAACRGRCRGAAQRRRRSMGRRFCRAAELNSGHETQGWVRRRYRPLEGLASGPVHHAWRHRAVLPWLFAPIAPSPLWLPTPKQIHRGAGLPAGRIARRPADGQRMGCDNKHPGRSETFSVSQEAPRRRRISGLSTPQSGMSTVLVLVQFRLELTRAQLPVPCLQQMLISCPLWQGRLVTVQ